MGTKSLPLKNLTGRINRSLSDWSRSGRGKNGKIKKNFNTSIKDRCRTFRAGRHLYGLVNSFHPESTGFSSGQNVAVHSGRNKNHVPFQSDSLSSTVLQSHIYFFSIQQNLSSPHNGTSARQEREWINASWLQIQSMSLLSHHPPAHGLAQFSQTSQFVQKVTAHWANIGNIQQDIIAPNQHS